ncbi:MAG: leucine-rich repeat domain-containing protein [Promethearchaeota archaeon]
MINLTAGVFRTYQGVNLPTNEIDVLEELEYDLGQPIPPIRLMIFISDDHSFYYGDYLNDFGFFAEEDHVTRLALTYLEMNHFPESIGNLVNLKELNLRENQLQILPESLGQLQNLHTLHLGWNQLQALPDIIGQLHNLQNLNLCANRLHTLPESICHLQNLQILDLSYNQFQRFPDVVTQLQNLTVLRLSWNELQSLPKTIGQLQNLQQLDLWGNPLRLLPKSFEQLSNLHVLRMWGSRLQTFPKHPLVLPYKRASLEFLNNTLCPFCTQSKLLSRGMPDQFGAKVFCPSCKARFRWLKDFCPICGASKLLGGEREQKRSKKRRRAGRELVFCAKCNNRIH